MGCASWPDGSHEAAAATATRKRRGERAQSTQQSSTRAPAAAAAAAASRSAVATPEEQAGQERRDRWKGQGRGKAARLRRSRARWDGTRFGERERGATAIKRREIRGRSICLCCLLLCSHADAEEADGLSSLNPHSLSLSCFFFPPFTAAKYMGEVCRMQCRNGEGQSDRGR